MDPRRSNDPRLTRDPRRDPRLARTAETRAHSGSPVPPGPVQVIVPTHAPQPHLAATPSILTNQTALKVKQRPLFCMVCANNQVGYDDIISFDGRFTVGYHRIARWRDIMS